MSLNDLKTVFIACNNILQREFDIAGYSISFYDLIIFEILGVIILGSILRLFHRDE